MNLKKNILSLAFLIISSVAFAQDWVEKDVDFFTERIKTRILEEDSETKFSEEQETKIKAYFKEFTLLKGKRVKFKDIFKDKDLEIEYYETVDSVLKVLTPKQLKAYQAIHKAK